MDGARALLAEWENYGRTGVTSEAARRGWMVVK